MLPDLAHLPDLIAIVGVATLAAGLGSLAGARRLEVALAVGWGLAVTAIVAVGTLTDLHLEPVMVTLGALGVLGLGRVIACAWRGRSLLEYGMAARVLVLAVPLFVLIETAEPASWDEFSHWLPNLAYLFEHGHFPSLTVPNDQSAHPAYPYGLALVGFGTSLVVGRLSETAGIFWNALMMLAAAACIAGVVERRSASARPGAAETAPRHAWASAGLGLLLGGFLCPSSLPNVVLSNMTDAATAAVVTIICSLLFEWFDDSGPDTEDRRFRAAVAIAFSSVALVGLRQTNLVLFALLTAGVVYAAWVEGERIAPARWATLALPLALPIGVWWLWNIYSSRQIPGGAFSLLPPGQWRWTLFPTTLVQMLHTVVTKIALFGLIALIFVRALARLRGAGPSTPAERALLLVVATLCLGNIGFLAFTYLAANFPEADVLGAAQFGRYVGQTGQAAVFAMMLIVPARWLAVATRPRLGVLVCVVALLTPVIGARALRYDLKTPTALARRVGRELGNRLPAAAPIRLVSPVGNGFDALVAAYQIRFGPGEGSAARHPVTLVSYWQGLSEEALRAQSAAPPPFLWLGEGGPTITALFGLTLPAGCSYLLAADKGRFDILQRWPNAVRTAASRQFDGEAQRLPTCR